MDKELKNLLTVIIVIALLFILFIGVCFHFSTRDDGKIACIKNNMTYVHEGGFEACMNMADVQEILQEVNRVNSAR